MSRFEELDTFVQTVRAGSFTAAARQLGMAKSAVSRRISELEKRLGVQLMTRSTRQLHLTDEGRALYDRAGDVLLEWEERESSVGAQHLSLSGTVRVSLPLSFGVKHVGPATLSFMQRHPQLGFDIDFSDRKVDLIAEGFDLAVRIGDLEDSTLIARPLAPIALCAVASPEFLEQRARPQAFGDLITFPEVRFGHRERKSWSYTQADGALADLEMQSRLTASSGEFLCQAAINGHGVAILPRFIVAEAIERKALCELLPEHPWPELFAYAVYPQTRHLPQRLRSYIDFLVDILGKELRT